MRGRRKDDLSEPDEVMHTLAVPRRMKPSLFRAPAQVDHTVQPRRRPDIVDQHHDAAPGPLIGDADVPPKHGSRGHGGG